MRLKRSGIAILSAFLPTVLVTRSAQAQCRVFTLPPGCGAVDDGSAIVSRSWTAEVQFYAKSPAGWQEQQPSYVVGDRLLFFSLPVAIEGRHAIVGSCESTGAGGESAAGRAFVFNLVDGLWVPTQLVPATAGEGLFFGSAVAISGPVAAVGAKHWKIDGSDGMPSVHVFEYHGAVWSEVLEIEDTGEAIDLEGDTLVVGSDRRNDGWVDIYRRSAGGWSRVQHLRSPLASPRMGRSVSLEGDLLAVGAVAGPPILDGYVQIYEFQGGAWVEGQRIVSSDGPIDDRFGSSVALSGTTLLVGIPGVGPTGDGAVDRFERIGGTFVKVDRIEPGADTDDFGWQVSFRREDAVVASYDAVSFFRLGFVSQSSFCPTTPNSTGSSGLLAAGGCDSVSGRRLTLAASGLPADVVALGFCGEAAVQVPYGDGFRCVGSPLFRFPASTSDAAGAFVHDVDFTSGAGAQLAPGRTWNFQVVHRDPASAGVGFNLTNALSILLTP